MKNPSRRDFIARSSLLLAGLGLTPSMRIEVLEKMGKKLGVLGSDLYANELTNSKSQFCIEILFRAGYPFDSIFALPVDMNMGRVAMCSTDGTPEAMLSRRAAAHTPQSVTRLDGTAAGTNLYLSPFASALAPLVQDGTIGMAGCQAIRTNGGHNGNFSTRMVAQNSGQMVGTAAPCPAIHFATAMPTSTILKGIEWKQNDGDSINNAPTGYAPLTRVGGGTNQNMVNGVNVSQQGQNFLGLFSPAQIPFSTEEASLIASAAEKLNRNYISYRSIRDSENVLVSANLGMDLLTRDFRAALAPSMTEYTDFNMATQMGGVRLGESLSMIVKAFSLGLIRSATITINTGDWHGRMGAVNFSDPNYNPENTDYARYARFVSGALAQAYTAAKSLPNPHLPGKTVAEGMTTLMTTEFSRTLAHQACNNHDDGGSNFIGIIGPTAKNLTAANWSHTNGQTVSIDRVSGQLDINAPLFTTGSAYATLCSALGISAASIGRFTSDPAILAMLKS